MNNRIYNGFPDSEERYVPFFFMPYGVNVDTTQCVFLNEIHRLFYRQRRVITRLVAV